ncbi:hypothetical protein AB0G32_34550 [Streptomyces sp. NPDC023723]
MLDVVGIEPGNPRQRLRVEKNKDGCHAVLEREGVAVDELS